MSFGFSPNDIVALVNITTKAYRGWKRACGEYSEITGSLDSLLIVLERIEKEASDSNSVLVRSADDRQELKDLLFNSEPTVRKLYAIVNGYKSLGSRSREKNWDKLRLGVKDLDPLCGKLTQHIAAITAYLDAVGLGALARIERDVDAIPEHIQRAVDTLASEIRAGRREGSIMTTYSDDEKDVWRQFRRELIGEGMRSSFVHKYKPLIRRYLKELADRGQLEELPPDQKQMAQEVLLDSAQSTNETPDTSIGVSTKEIASTGLSDHNNSLQATVEDPASENDEGLDHEPIWLDQADSKGDEIRSTPLTRNESTSAKREVAEPLWTSKVSKWMERASPASSTATVPNMSLTPETLQPLADVQEGLHCNREGEQSALSLDEYATRRTAKASVVPDTTQPLVVTPRRSTEKDSKLQRVESPNEPLVQQKLYYDGNEEDESEDRLDSDASQSSKGAKTGETHESLVSRDVSNTSMQNKANDVSEAVSVLGRIVDTGTENAHPPGLPREAASSLQGSRPRGPPTALPLAGVRDLTSFSSNGPGVEKSTSSTSGNSEERKTRSTPQQSTPNTDESHTPSETTSTMTADSYLKLKPEQDAIHVPAEKTPKTRSYIAFKTRKHHGKGVLKACPRCDGQGTKMVTHSGHKHSGVCPACLGVGKLECCAKCGGQGKRTKTFDLPGIKTKTGYVPSYHSEYEATCSGCDGPV